MADIFISYARGDRNKAERLSTALEGKGYSVWWDRQIVGGAEFSEEIERELNAAKAVIVGWSAEAIKSAWVKDEASAAHAQGKMIPVRFDHTSPPMGFRQYQAMHLERWQGGVDAPAFQDLLRTLKVRLTGETRAPTPQRKLRLQTLRKFAPHFSVGAILFAIVAAVFFFYAPITYEPSARDEASTTTIQNKLSASPMSIAVLPFTDLSPQGDQEYFTDGISEEILNVLASVDGLKTASRTSTFQFKGQQAIGIPIIAQQLNVRHVLEGSVRKAGENIRITVQLIDAGTDKHLWSANFDRALTTENIFAIQGEIAKAVVDELSARLNRDISLPAQTKLASDTKNIGAYELYLEGYARFVQRGRDNISKGMASLERSVSIDPQFARAWAVLSGAYAIAPGWLAAEDLNRDYLRLARDAATKAIELDNSLALPFAVLGSVARMETPGRYEASLAYFDEAIRREPNNETIYMWRGEVWRDLGFFKRSIDDFNRCLVINPEYVICRAHASKSYSFLNDKNKADELYLENLRYGFRVPNYSRLGAYLDKNDITGVLNRLNTLANQFAEIDARWMVEMMYQALTNPEYDRSDALDLIQSRLENVDAWPTERSYTKNQIFLIFGAYDRIDPISGDMWWPTAGFPEFNASLERKRIMRKRGIDAYWREHGFPPHCHPIGQTDFECD